MAKIIKSYNASFEGINLPITLTIPKGSEEVALRVFRDQEELSLFVLFDPSLPSTGTYTRTFELIGVDDPLPDNYVKYIATLPFGPSLTQVHLIEVMQPAPTPPPLS
jgi:hypothetical protein